MNFVHGGVEFVLLSVFGSFGGVVLVTEGEVDSDGFLKVEEGSVFTGVGVRR